MFSSYNIKKMMPRIIAAAILIQISWALGTFVVNLSNDLGKGINLLMYEPFGGVGSVDNIGKALGESSVAGGGILLFTGGVALALFSGITVIGLFLLALPVLLAVIIGWFVLVLRQILIIMCVVFLPFALIAWVLPGTERYWKLFRDNFLKLLMMYPLIVALIAAGRIFGTLGGAVGGLAGFVIVLMGFFGPLFILPKTFQWGGAALGTMGGAIVNGTKGYRKKPGEFAMGRAKLNKEERTRKSMERVAGNEVFNSRRPWRFPIDKLKSGQWDPTLGGRDSRIRQTKVDSYVHAGEETYQKDVEAARSRVLREGQGIRAAGGNWDRYFQMVADGVQSYEDDKLGTVNVGKKSEVEQDAARKQLAILGSAPNWRYLEDYYQNTLGNENASQKEKVRARKFFDDNVSTIMPKMPHFYQGYAAAADATGASLAGMHGVEVESILSRLSSDIRNFDGAANDTSLSDDERAAASARRDSSQRSLTTFLQNFNAAASNENITLDGGALRAVKGFLDNSGGAAFREEINFNRDPVSGLASPDGRAIRNLSTLEAYDTLPLSPEYKATLDDINSQLAPRIHPVTGTLTSAGASPPTAGSTPP